MVYIIHSQSPQASLAAQNSASPTLRDRRNPSLENTLKIALEHARRLTALYGTDNIQVALAWETVEELLTAQARQREKSQTAFDTYCQLHPEAPECRVYDL